MRKLTRFTISASPALIFAGILAGSFPACDSGGDSDSTLPETTGSGGQSSANSASAVSNVNNSNATGIFTNGAGGETSGANSTGAGGDGGDCGGESVNAEPVKVNLLLVIDRSGSMTATPEGFDDDKWTTMVDSLNTALDGISGQMSVGLQFFPDASVEEENGCGVPSGSDIVVPVSGGSGAVNDVKAALGASENAPSGNTPTAAALALAHEYFTSGAGADLEGENYVLLALDGGPNCNSELTCAAESCTANIDGICPVPNDGSCCSEQEDPVLNLLCLDGDESVNQVKALAQAGITTFVVGIPGSDQAAYQVVLDDLAVEGGAPASTESPKYYQVTDADELSDTLVALTSDLVHSCELLLETAPPDENLVNVFVNGEVVAKPGDDGWEYDKSTSPPKIVIKGETCTAIESEGVESVSVEFGCPTVIDIPK